MSYHFGRHMMELECDEIVLLWHALVSHDDGTYDADQAAQIDALMTRLENECGKCPQRNK